jgi:hypothetical protein
METVHRVTSQLSKAAGPCLVFQPCQFIIHLSPFIRRYIVNVIDKASIVGKYCCKTMALDHISARMTLALV